MKKTLIAMAALAAAGVASAQSSVTLYGVVDLGISHGSASNSITQMTSGNVNSSRLGFKGTEDLGGGLKANFDIEGDVKPNSGTGATSGAASVNSSANNITAVGTSGGFTFNRMAWVSLSGGFGEIRLGRDYTPTFYADNAYDPFGTNGVATNPLFGNSLGDSVNHLRASNAVSYFLPGNLGGFSGQLMYALNNTASNAAAPDAGKYMGGRVGYDAGPVSLMLAYGKTKAVPAKGDVTTTELGGSYNFGMATVMAEYVQDKWSLVDAKKKGYLLGAVVPVGAGAIRASYASQKITVAGVTADNKYNLFGLGYLYNLSKRTALYAQYGHVSNKGISAVALNGSTGAAGVGSSGYDIGVRHSF